MPEVASARTLDFPPEVTRAERALRQGRADEAERILEEAGGLDPAAMERSWLWLDLGLGRARAAAVTAAVAALPPSPRARILAAHASRAPAARIAAVRGALGGPAGAWAHLESAMALAEEGGHADAVLAHAARAAAAGPAFVQREAWLVAAREALEDKRASEAVAFADRAAAVDPSDPRAPAWASRAAGRRGARDEAAIHAVSALRLQPTSARAARRLADLVRDGLAADVEARVRAEVASLARSSGEGLALAALLAERAGDRATALSTYERALAADADPVPVDRQLRRLLFAAGRRREALALLRRAVPPQAWTDPANLRGDAWRRVDALGAAAGEGPLDEGRALAFARALVDVGAVDEAAAVLGRPRDGAAAAYADRLARELRFEEAVRAAVEDGYRAPASGATPPPIEALLATVAARAKEHLLPDEAAALARPTTGMRRVPMLGAWLDHGVDTTSPVVAHFRRYGKHLILGQRDGKPAEAILLSLASLCRRQELRTQGRTFHHDVALGYDRTIRGYVDFQGGSLSGAALPDGVWLDADATRREDHALRRALASADAVLLARLDRVALDPPPCDGPEGPFALDDPAGLWLRIARRYAREVGTAPWASFDVLRAHEFGHVLDLDRHLPIARGLPATLGLLASEGFAFDRVEARLEGRAQLGAVIDAARPDLALLDLVRALPLVERQPEAHDRGYRDVVAAMVRWLERHAGRFPALDPTRKLLPQLDRLSPDELRQVARAVAAEGWSAAD